MYPSTKEIQNAINILQYLYENQFFNEWDIQYVTNWADENYELLKAYNIEIFHGDTKVCICDWDSKWVIKLNCQYKSEDFFDYCGREVENYEAAAKEGLEEYFAEIYKVGTYRDHDVFLQLRVNCDEGIADECLDQYIRDSLDEDDYIYCEEHNKSIEDEIEDRFDELDEEDYIDTFFDGSARIWRFCNERCINDFNSGGFGLKDGNWVLVDYSGYCIQDQL